MKILWMTWKDRENPLAGGAEVVHRELGKRLVADGHDVTFLVGGFPGASTEVETDGYRVVRVGGRYSVYLRAVQMYRSRFRGNVDLVIDEINTVPFFASFYVKERSVLFIHQLAREIWFYEMIFPLSIVGYLLEPVYLWLLRKREVITVSESTQKDLMKYGFDEANIHIISEGVTTTPSEDLGGIQKYEVPTVLCLGAVRAMKRTEHIVRAFEWLKDDMPDAKLIIAGDHSGHYGTRVARAVGRSDFSDDIELLGRVSQEKKIELMQRAHVIAVTSIKEGWGLIVTEAASQGTPAVVYDVDGLRDSVRHSETGLICDTNTPRDMAAKLYNILRIRINEDHLYKSLGKNAWTWSKQITFDKAYKDFTKIIKK